MCFREVGMSEVYMSKSVGERTPPCGTPVYNNICCGFKSWVSYAPLDVICSELNDGVRCVVQFVDELMHIEYIKYTTTLLVLDTIHRKHLLFFRNYQEMHTMWYKLLQWLMLTLQRRG